MKYPALLSALIAAGLAVSAAAQTTPAAPPVPTVRETERPPAAAMPAAPERKSPMLTDDELDDQRGGQTFVITNQTLNAITQGNVLNGDYTAGSVSLSDFALSNFNGVGNLLINTGAQVSVQSGMNLTINLAN